MSRRAWRKTSCMANRQASRCAGVPMPFGVFSRKHGDSRASFFGDQFFPLVLEVAVKLLSNPIVIRMGVVFVVMCIAFLDCDQCCCVRMRRVLTEEIFCNRSCSRVWSGCPCNTYNAVIQQLKQAET